MIDWKRYGLESHPGSEWSMDARHAELVKATLKRLRPTTAVEVGCHLGVSTLGILEAGVPNVHLIDVVMQPSVRRMAEDYGAKLHECRSDLGLLSIPPSDNLAVLLDGDHSLPAVQLEARLIGPMKPRCIISHDVTTMLTGLECEGCIWLWHTLQAAGWFCFVDCVPRQGERTSRGLMIATHTPEDYAQVVAACVEVNQ